MPPFHWLLVEQELHLAREVSCHRPEKPAEWDKIAQRLSEAFSDGTNFVELKGKGCRERIERRLQKRRAEDVRSLNRLVDYLCLILTVYTKFAVNASSKISAARAQQ